MSSGTSTQRRRWKRVVLASLIAVAGLAAAVYAIASLGRWLIVADALQPARAIVVLGGHLPFRAMEAASLYRAGWAGEVWLTQGGADDEELAMEELGIDTIAEQEYSRRVLERVGVPASAIRVLEGQNVNTADEVRTISRELLARGGGRVILVTSKFHTRRVRAIWNRLVGRNAEAVVRYTNRDPARPEGWWKNTRDAMAVARETTGLLNVWAGFPLQSRP